MPEQILPNCKLKYSNIDEKIFAKVKTPRFKPSLIPGIDEVITSMVSQTVDSSNATYIAIPRSGFLVMNSLLTKLKISTIIYVNVGHHKVPWLPVLPATLFSSNSYVIGDAFIVTGNTLATVIQEILSNEESRPQIAVYAMGMSELALDPQGQLMQLLHSNTCDLTLNIGNKVEHSYVWDEKQHKKVPVLGTVKTDKHGKMIAFDMGDYGQFYDDAVSAGLIKSQGSTYWRLLHNFTVSCIYRLKKALTS